MERDKFMSPMEAKNFGIIDKVLEHPLQDPEQISQSSENTKSSTI
jgi:ATP-dependent Clp protease protease subunit